MQGGTQQLTQSKTHEGNNSITVENKNAEQESHHSMKGHAAPN